MAQKKQKKHAIYPAGYAQTLICAKNCTRDVHLLQALGAPPYQNPTLLQRTGYYGLLIGYVYFFSFLPSDAAVAITQFPRYLPRSLGIVPLLKTGRSVSDRRARRPTRIVGAINITRQHLA